MDETPSPALPAAPPATLTADEQHLDVLAIIHFVFGGLTIFGGLFAGIYLVIGIMLILFGSSLPPGAFAPPPSITAPASPAPPDAAFEPMTDAPEVMPHAMPAPMSPAGPLFDDAPQHMLKFMGGFIIAIGLICLLLITFQAGLLIWAGKNLKQRRGHTFCIVAAAIECAWFPFGTLLGVFSIIVLSRPHVKELFDRHLTA